MIRRAGHTVNDRLTPTTGALPSAVAGVDIAISEANVVAWGGQAWLYRQAFDAGLRVAGARPDRTSVWAIGSLAGWRSGALDLRLDALRRLAELHARHQDAVAGAVLGLSAGAVPAFLDAQRDSPLGWPAYGRTDPVARVGGFKGLGGPWLAPPREVVRATDGAVLVRCADDGWWRLEVDVFGHRLWPTEPAAAHVPVTAGVSADSYLLTVTAELG